MRRGLFLVGLLQACLLCAQVNTALEAHPRLEIDQYDWYARHERIVREVKTLNPQIILLGDSITHFWGSETDGAPARGQASWDKLFATYRVLNAGFGWDRVQNVRWRIRNGEVDGTNPELVLLHIGTNNWSGTKNARRNTPQETALAIHDLTKELETCWPKARIIVFDIYPRSTAKSPVRQWIRATNQELAKRDWSDRVQRLSVEKVLTQPNGELIPGTFVDGVHPSAKGYALISEYLKPYLQLAPTANP